MKLFFPKKNIPQLTNALSLAHDFPDVRRETFGPIY